MNPKYTFQLRPDTNPNLLNPANGVSGYVSIRNGEIVADDTNITSEFIPVNPTQTQYLYLKHRTIGDARIVTYALYDANKIFIEGDGDTFDIALTSNTRFVRVSVDGATLQPYSLQAQQTAPYVPYIYTIHPVYNTSVTKDYERQQNELFYRAKINGKFTFVGDDFDIVNNAPFDTKFTFVINMSLDGGATYVEYFRGEFWKTNCKFNADGHNAEISVSPVDGYADVIAGLDKEFDLIKLKPELTAVTIFKRPLIQIYVPGESVVSCFLSGMYWEQDCDVVTDETELTDTYKFALVKNEHDIKVYARMLCDVTTISGLNTTAIPANDIVENNRNYNRVIPYDFPDTIYFWNGTSTEPTEWGISQPGVYYTMPQYPAVLGAPDTYYPIGRSHWGDWSIWFAFSLYDTIFENEGRKRYALRDATPLSSAISVLLREIAPGITHEATPDYSHFLYDEYNPISGDTFKLLLTQKANLLSGDYTQPSQKAPITLKMITDMLRNVFCAYWYVEDGKFKIEHISWFKNGGQYTGTPIVSRDLTAEFVSRNGKDWAFATSQYEYEKETMPERYQFGWMDEVTDVFTGNPINMLSGFVTAGKIEEITVNNFTTDVDYMLLNPGACSKDGFALLAAVPGSDVITPDTTSRVLSIDTYTRYGLDRIYSGTTVTFRVMFTGTGTVDLDLLDARGEYKQTLYTLNVTQPISTFVFSVPIPRQQIGNVNLGFIKNTAGTIRIRLMSATAGYELPFVSYLRPGTIDDRTNMQNGFLSFVNLQPKYHLYDMPAYHVEVNGVDTYAYGIQRKKKQTLRFPVAVDPDPMHLIKTHLGNGQIEKISVNLSSRNANATLAFDTQNLNEL